MRVLNVSSYLFNVVLAVVFFIVVSRMGARIQFLENQQQPQEEMRIEIMNDCKRIITGERVMSYMIGCQRGLEWVCGGTANCFNSLKKVCEPEYDGR